MNRSKRHANSFFLQRPHILKKVDKISPFSSLCCAMLSCSVVSDSFQHHELYLQGSSCSWDSPGKNTGVGCHTLLQGICPSQGSNPGIPHCRWILYHLSHQGSPRIAGVGTLSLLHGIFLIQKSKGGLLLCRQILYQLSYQGSPYPHYQTIFLIFHFRRYLFTSHSILLPGPPCSPVCLSHLPTLLSQLQSLAIIWVGCFNAKVILTAKLGFDLFSCTTFIFK